MNLGRSRDRHLSEWWQTGCFLGSVFTLKTDQAISRDNLGFQYQRGNSLAPDINIIAVEVVKCKLRKIRGKNSSTGAGSFSPKDDHIVCSHRYILWGSNPSTKTIFLPLFDSFLACHLHFMCLSYLASILLIFASIVCWTYLLIPTIRPYVPPPCGVAHILISLIGPSFAFNRLLVYPATILAGCT